MTSQVDVPMCMREISWGSTPTQRTMRNQWLIREEESVFFRDEPLMGSSSSVAKYTILGTGHEFEREYRRDVGRVGERKRETMQILQSHMKFSKKQSTCIPKSTIQPQSYLTCISDDLYIPISLFSCL